MSEEHAVQVIAPPGRAVSAREPRSPVTTSGQRGQTARRPGQGAAIRATGLTKSYRRHPALRGLDLEVPAGGVFGYLGPNGAGKTTTIRLVTGLLRRTAGSIEVLGLSPSRDRDRLQRRLGYLPGNFSPYPDLTVRQFLAYLGSLRGGVSPTVVDALVTRLGLSLEPRIGTLSHGNRQKVGLVQAFMHEPELLVLDEPTTGLDPLVQREFASLVHEARDSGRTVFLSSHVLSEVEALADTVGILRAGRLVTVQSVEDLRAQAVRRIDLTFEGAVPVEPLRRSTGVRELDVEGCTAHLVVEGSTADVLRATAPHGISAVVSHEPDLGEIFLRYYATEA